LLPATMEHVSLALRRLQPEVVVCRTCGGEVERPRVNLVPVDRPEVDYVTDGTECDDCYGIDFE
jgi:uncharacterized protein with PIN domain